MAVEIIEIQMLIFYDVLSFGYTDFMKDDTIMVTTMLNLIFVQYVDLQGFAMQAQRVSASTISPARAI